MINYFIQYSRFTVSKLRGNKLNKKAGDDKLVISLILIAVGVVLCFLYRDQIMGVIKNAVTSLGTKINDMFSSYSGGTGGTGNTTP